MIKYWMVKSKNKNSYFLFLLMFVCSSFSSNAQISLQSAYKADNVGLVDSIIKDHTPKKGSLPQLDSLITAFYKYYTDSIKNKKSKNKVLNEYYSSNNFFLQSTILFARTNNNEFHFRKNNVSNLNGDYFYRYRPDTIYNELDYYYKILDFNFALKPKIVVKSFVDQINSFLGAPGLLSDEAATERKNRAYFLKKQLNINQTIFTTLNTGIPEYEFTYGYFIDRIILNNNKSKAIIQCRIQLPGQHIYHEYIFHKVNGIWVRITLFRDAIL